MGNQFGASPDVLTTQGGVIGEQAAQFKKNEDLIYETLNSMLTSNYVSPAAKALGEEIISKKGILDEMHTMMSNYSSYATMAGKTITNNEQNIIDTYTSK